MKGSRVLVVEDHAVVAADLSCLLGELECRVLGTVSSGAEALRLAESELPDLVLMDIRLDGEPDGIEAATKLRTTYSVPVVFVTAHTDPEILERARRAEPLGYLVKPISKAALRATLSMALYRAAHEREREEGNRWRDRILDAFQDAVLAADTQGMVRFMNTIAEGFTGTRWADAQERPLATLLAAAEGEAWSGLAARSHECGGVTVEVRLTSAPGTAFWASVVPVREGPVPRGVIVTLRPYRGSHAGRAESAVAVLCAGCKRLREQDGTWVEVERFLIRHLRVMPSHGICDKCFAALYPEYADKPRHD